jgi:hypothetical protein
MTAGDDGTRTADGRYRIVSGRRHRAADPAIPEPLRRQLEAELADAATDPARLRYARVALGEEGEPWWEPTPGGRRVRLAAAMRALLWHRRPDATICPSDAARVAGGESWRDLMATAREVAGGLAAEGVVVVRQHGADVEMGAAVGPVRLARGPRW